ncbi:MAG: tetratricopeptide repeat protein [Bryobacteraceae bacterium]|nr:tetratricopeptide repeat protein [Bryobacteraceae bacterium]
MFRVLAILLGLGAFAQQHSLQDAVTALRNAEFDRAIEILRPLIETAPGNPQLWTMQGIAFASSGHYDEALRSFREAARLKPDLLAPLLGAAQIEFERKDPQAGLTLGRILSIQPGNEEAHAMMATLAYDAQNCDAAVAHFEQAEARLRDDLAGQWRYGHCLLEVKQPAKAAGVFEKLWKAAPREDRVRYGLGVALYEAERIEEAIEVLRPLAAGDAPRAEVLALLADAYRASHQTPEALETLKRAIALYPGEEIHYVALADLCMEHGSYELGLEVLDAGAANLPQSSRIRAMRGVMHAQLGQFEAAEAEFAKAEALDPKEVSAGMGRTLTLQETGRIDESIKRLRQQIKQHPADPVTNLLLAQALVKKGVAPGQAEFDEARKALEAAVAADPREVAARVELGKLLLKTDDISGAARQFEEAVRLEPGERTATYQLMRCYRRLGKTEEAAALMTRLRGQLDKGMEDDAKTNRYRLVKTDR